MCLHLQTGVAFHVTPSGQLLCLTTVIYHALSATTPCPVGKELNVIRKTAIIIVMLLFSYLCRFCHKSCEGP